MIREVSPLTSKDQTGQAMYRLVEMGHAANDLGELAKMPLPLFFDKVRKIPYRRDPKGKETVARPSLLLKEFPEMDCKKKAILMAAWLKKNNVPFRFIAVSEIPSKKFHHVFVIARVSGAWRNVDATYPHYTLFQKKPRVTRRQILKP